MDDRGDVRGTETQPGRMEIWEGNREAGPGVPSGVWGFRTLSLSLPTSEHPSLPESISYLHEGLDLGDEVML